MNEHFLEHLENTGLIRNGVVNTNKIGRVRISTLADIAEQSTELTSAEYLSREQSVFAHSASLSLGGDRSDHCGNLACRLSSAYELAQFASLYSDRVYIRNFSVRYLPYVIGEFKGFEDIFRERLIDDLTIISKLRPLISKGIIVPFSPPTAYCPCCLAKLYLSSQFEAPFQKAYEELKTEYLNKVSYTLKLDSEGVRLKMRGPESLIEHGQFEWEYFKIPPELLQIPDLLKKARKGKGVILSKEDLSLLHYHENEADRVVENIAFELTAAQTLNTSFLTNKSLHIEFLNSINYSPNIERRNKIARQYLTSFVPFLNGAKLEDLIKLRENEEEAFILYRQSLNRAIDEYREQGEDFSEKDAKALYSDVIAPKLAGLDQKVKAAKRTLVKETIRETAAWVGAISFGIYLGVIPTHLVEAAKLLGMTKILADFIKTTMGRRDITSNIRNEDMYFLWKVREASRR